MEPDQTIIGRGVRFKVKNSFLPEPRDLSLALLEGHELEGVVVDVSRDSAGSTAFVVVRLAGKDHRVVVSLDAVTLI